MADIINVVKHGGYSLMSTFHLTDNRLSWTAKGLMSAFLSFAGECSIENLAEATHNGKIDTAKGVEELERHGYLTWEQVGYDGDGLPVIKYVIHEWPIRKICRRTAENTEAVIPNVEDVPNRTLSADCNEEEVIGLRERLHIQKAVEKCSKNFVEMVFRELCRRDAEFKKRMTAEAFEYVCSAIWERQKSNPTNPLFGLINVYFDNIAKGIQCASGGNEPVVQKKMIDISSPCGYDKNK